MKDVTRDALFDGELSLLQPARGYRVNVDALLLAHFCGAKRVARLVDLGAGVGAIALALHHLGSVREALLVEKDPELVELARENLAHNAVSGTVHLFDLSGGRVPRGLASSADLVVCNPPFFEPRTGRDRAESAGRGARFGQLGPFVVAAAKLLGSQRARACFCYPAHSLALLLEEARAAKLVAKRLRLVHALGSEPARLALVELRRARPGGLVVEPGLVEWDAPGARSAELSALLDRRASGRR